MLKLNQKERQYECRTTRKQQTKVRVSLRYNFLQRFAPKDANSEAQSTKVEHEYLTILRKIGQDSRGEDLEHLQQNHIEKYQQLGENKNNEKIQIVDKESSIVLEEDITTNFQKKKEKSLTISQRQNDVKLKRWGREQDRKILSY